MTVPEYTKKAIERYRDKFDIVQVRLPKGTRDRITALEESANNYIVQAVIERLEADEREGSKITQISDKSVQVKNIVFSAGKSRNSENKEPVDLYAIQAEIDRRRAEEQAKREAEQKAEEERKRLIEKEYINMVEAPRAGNSTEEDQEKERIRRENIARANMHH